MEKEKNNSNYFEIKPKSMKKIKGYGGIYTVQTNNGMTLGFCGYGVTEKYFENEAEAKKWLNNNKWLVMPLMGMIMADKANKLKNK